MFYNLGKFRFSKMSREWFLLGLTLVYVTRSAGNLPHFCAGAVTNSPPMKIKMIIQYSSCNNFFPALEQTLSNSQPMLCRLFLVVLKNKITRKNAWQSSFSLKLQVVNNFLLRNRFQILLLINRFQILLLILTEFKWLN